MRRRSLAGLVSLCLAVSPLLGQDGPAASFLTRPGDAHLRLMTWNIGGNSVFDDPGPRGFGRSDGGRPARFRRVAAALSPDIVCLQEVFPPRGAADVGRLLDAALPLPARARWHVHGEGDVVIASRFPLSLPDGRTADWGGGVPRSHAMARVEVGGAAGLASLYMVCAHAQSRGEAKDIAARQEQADAIAAWVQDLRTPGGGIDLPTGTPIVLLGDWNAYRTDPAHHVETLRAGEIVDQERFGRGGPPDWDGSPLRDALPSHNGEGRETYTFGDGSDGEFPPAALDRVLFTDSVLALLGGFVLDTMRLSPDLLSRAGLLDSDVLLDAAKRLYDHLPVVVDLAPAHGRSGAARGEPALPTTPTRTDS